MSCTCLGPLTYPFSFAFKTALILTYAFLSRCPLFSSSMTLSCSLARSLSISLSFTLNSCSICLHFAVRSLTSLSPPGADADFRSAAREAGLSLSWAFFNLSNPRLSASCFERNLRFSESAWDSFCTDSLVVS